MQQWIFTIIVAKNRCSQRESNPQLALRSSSPRWKPILFWVRISQWNHWFFYPSFTYPIIIRAGCPRILVRLQETRFIRYPPFPWTKKIAQTRIFNLIWAILRQTCFHLCKAPFGTRLVPGAPGEYNHSVPSSPIGWPPLRFSFVTIITWFSY